MGFLLVCLWSGTATAFGGLLPEIEIEADDIKLGSFSLIPSIGGYVFAGAQGLKHNILYGFGFGYRFNRHWTGEALFNYVRTETDPGGVDVDAWLYRLEGLYHFFPHKKLVPYFAAGIGALSLDPVGGTKDTDFLISYGLGLKYFFSNRIALRSDLRHVIPFDDPHHNLAASIGIEFLIGGQKKAPSITPTAPKDSDGDGIYDSADKCPNTPMGVRVEISGCPFDSDGDGIDDYLDKCPGTPAGALVDRFGCPTDGDGDGVYDDSDKCPNTPEGSSVDKMGCALDVDEDGVFDYFDKCPDTPAGLTVDQNGCPIFQKEKKSIRFNIEFDPDKAEIKPIYHDQIQQVADFLKTYPETEMVIEGHTDNVGPADYNLKLSQRRAESVKRFLIDNFGIGSNRLKAKGYGEKRRIASNATQAGRQRNRRVIANITALKAPSVYAGSSAARIQAQKVLSNDGVEFKLLADQTEEVIVWLSSAFPPHTFILQGERPRMVCDFYEARPGVNIPDRIDVGGHIIKQIRLGHHAGANQFLRVVMDLNFPFNYRIQQRLNTNNNSYVIQLQSNKIR